ncbi:MAG: hypothetical protein GY754_09680 [bacterium]|nr:hypothetical protein [bacterium]
MKTRIICLVVLLALVPAIFSCKKSSKNENNKYDNNITTIDEFITTYPAFKGYLEELKKKAETEWAAAEKLTDQGEKAEKLSALNDMIYKNELYSSLNSYEGQIDSIRRLQKDLTNIEDAPQKMMNAGAKSITSLEEASLILGGAAPRNFGEAVETVKKATSKLIDAAGNLRRVKKLAKKK